MRGITIRRGAGLASGILMCAVFGAVHAQEVIRTPLADGNPFPISAAVTVPAGLDTVYLSGAVAQPTNKDAPKGTPPVYGDTEEQTMSVLTQIKATLTKMGLDMGDIVKMTAFMVGDPAKGNKLDFTGFMASYTKFFATPEQPNKPARSAFQIAALAAPGALIEIEVVAVKPKHRPKSK